MQCCALICKIDFFKFFYKAVLVIKSVCSLLKCLALQVAAVAGYII